jgi:hypothetical protein
MNEPLLGILILFLSGVLWVALIQAEAHSSSAWGSLAIVTHVLLLVCTYVLGMIK